MVASVAESPSDLTAGKDRHSPHPALILHHADKQLLRQAFRLQVFAPIMDALQLGRVID